MSVGQIITAKAGEFANTFLAPQIRYVTYQGNQAMRNLIPDPDSALNAWLNGFLGPDQAGEVIAKHGISMRIGDINLTSYAGRDNRSQPAELRTGFEEYTLTTWQGVLRDRLYAPSIDECNILLNRKLITQTLYDYLVGKQVGNSKVMTEVWSDMRFEIPGPSDLIRFAVRDAYFPDLVELFGYHHEVPTKVLPWMEKQGFGGPTDIVIPPGGSDYQGQPRGGDATWFDIHWWAHWQLPSVGQGYEMLHRLYPTSDYGRAPLAEQGTNFDQDTLEKLMRGSDIPDYWRKRLTAISFHPIDKGDGEFLYENGMATEADLYHIMRSHGHNDTDSKILITASELRRKRNLGIDPGKAGTDYVCEYYKLGIVTDNDAVVMLQKLGFNADDTDAFLSKCKLEIKGESAKQLIATWEQAYYRGIYNDEEIRLEILKHGINPAVSQYWLAQWKYRRNVRYKAASAKQNLTAFKNGVLSEPFLVTRLFNLGYDGNSINVMIANEKALMIQAQNQALLKQAQQLAKQQKAAAQAALNAQKKKLKQEQQDAKIVTNKANKRMRNFIKSSSDANIKAWQKAGLISLWEIAYRLYYKGYGISDATKWITATFPDEKKGDIDAATAKAATQFRNEGNYLEQ